MVAKKPSVERAWKIAAINRYIADQQALISKLDAAVKSLPADAPDRGRLASAQKRLAELKKQKRHPGTLLTLADSVRRPDNPLTVDVEMLDRLRRHPAGSEDVLAVLEAELQRITDKDGSVGAHFERQRAQRQKALKPRDAGNDGRNTDELVADVVRGHPPDAKPKELLPHVHAAIEASGKEPIKDKWARELIGRARRARSSKRRT